MGNPTATLERENLSAMNLPARELDEVERRTTPRVVPAATMKFTYPSGSRPLEGYTIKRGVGRGGFGEVYFATSDAGKEVALKLIRRNLEVELRGVTQCLNLKHPNLIALYDIRTDDAGDQWVIMEYVSGESLEDVIDRNPSGMPLAEALWWMRGICGGVAYLHDHGIVHRDLKPGNIFYDEGTIKIGDYGLAKFISCSRRSGQTESVGTVHYMAPEIANGRYGREIDTYALGIILFEMLTGRVPFEGESVGEVLMKHLTAEPDLSALDEPYRDIVRRALAKDPNVRLNSVGEIVALLPGGGGAFAPLPPGVDTPQKHQYASESSAFDARQPAADTTGNGQPAGYAARTAAATADNDSIEEPIWKAIREGARQFRESWHGENGKPAMHPLMKALVVFGTVMCSIWFFEVMIRLTVPLAICYGVYYVIWASAIRPGASRNATKGRSVSTPKSSANASVDQQTIAWQRAGSAITAPAEEVKTTRSARRRRPNWREAAQRELAAKPLRAKSSELLGSMLVAAIVSAVAAGIGPLVLGSQPDSERAAMYLWLASVGTLGSWAILVPSKFAEGKLEDQVPMRVSLLASGALVGFAAWFLGDMLLLKSPGWRDPIDAGQGLISQELLDWPRPNEVTSASLGVYVAYFAFLFLLPRWWRQAEYTRGSRISVWWIIVSVFWAWVLHLFWWFPQPAGMMAAAVVATATQLSSAWMPPSRRRVLSDFADQTV
jgi:Protein kinase domain